MNGRKLLVSVLILVSVILSACASATATPPAPTVVPPTVAPTAIPPTVAPTVAPAQEQTTFSSSTFKLPMTLSYESDWKITQYPNQVYLQKLRTDFWQITFNLVDGAMIADPNSAGEIPWPQDLVAYLRSNPYIEPGEPKPVMVGGFKGIQIDAHAKYTGDKRSFITIAGPAEGWLYLDYEEMWRFIVLDDVNGETLVIAMTASPTNPTTPVTEFSMFTDEAQKVLDTVVFSQPTTFSPKTFNLPITFHYGPEWKIDAENSSYVSLLYKAFDGELLFINPKSAKVAGPAAPYSVIPFPDDFVNWIQAHSLFQVVKTQSVLVDGLHGTQIDADATPACGAKTTWFLVGAGGWNCGSGGHYRFIYMDDVNGERLLIMTVGYVSAQDFMLMEDASQKVLDMVVFSKP
jgi:hypothetical protein